jgi:hypothetical protein
VVRPEETPIEAAIIRHEGIVRGNRRKVNIENGLSLI